MRSFILTLVLLVPSLGLAHQHHHGSAPTHVIRSAASGSWSAGTTWEGGKVPGANAAVLIRPGHRVTYDIQSDAIIRGINIGGSLVFASEKDTTLNVGLIKIQAGEKYSEDGFDCDAHLTKNEEGHESRPRLQVGTPQQPIRKRALIRLHYLEGMNKESCPAIVNCGGQMDFHGQPLSKTWVKLGASAKAGDRNVQLAEGVTGWNIGDRVIITATQTHGTKAGTSHTEEAVITAIEGNTLKLDKSLEYPHAGEGDFRGEVANLSRNITVESADPAGVRGHTMFHRDSSGSLSYTEFRHLGKKNVLGRYSLHFHLCGDTLRGSSVIGNSIWDSHNRWLTIHGTNYLIVRDNVGYRSIGHGYFLEDGTEVHNVLDRNLAVLAQQGKKLPKQVLPFDQNEGAGYWWANSLNTFTRNVAAECDLYGFRYEATPTSALKLNFPIEQPDGSQKETDIRTLPFVRFEDNEVHSSQGLYGVNLGEGVNRVGPDVKHPFVVRNLKIWDVHYGFRVQVPSLLVENLTIHQAHYGIYHPNYDNHVYRNVVISETNTEPFNRAHDDDSTQYGKLTVDGLTFIGIRSGGMPLIQISDHNPTGTAESHFRNVTTVRWNDGSKQRALVNLGGGPRPQPKSETSVPIYLHDWYGSGKHARVVSMKSGDYKSATANYRAESSLTGDESRVTEVTNVEFPQLLHPVDDLPPTSVVTHLRREGKMLHLRGCSADNGDIQTVTVNGSVVKAIRDNFAEWEITVPLSESVKVTSRDQSGNEERPLIVKLNSDLLAGK